MNTNILPKLQRQFRLPLLTLALITVMVFGFARSASAATAGGNGLRVSPVRTDITINPGSSQTVNITVTNVTADNATFQTIVNDFIANPNESGNPAIILDPTKYASSHSLKRFVGPVSTFSLPAGQEKTVPIVITVPKTAAAGGYYGAVRFAPAGSNPANKTVSLSGSVGSLILVKVPGNIDEQMSIASFDSRVNDSPSSFFTSGKHIEAVVRFQNEGNIQEAPFGKILLKNHSGKQIASFEVNNVTPAGNVLPDSIRKFSIPLTKVSSFGQYKLEGNFGYGSNGQLLSASTTFYVIPTQLIIIFIAIVALLLFLIFGLPRLIRAYNRRVLAKAGRAMSKASRK